MAELDPAKPKGAASDEVLGPKSAYHHGDLGRALVALAVQIIGEEGVEALTLREVGQRLGVSRTALYRHFDGKGALLEAVALEGFIRLRSALEEALAQAEPLGRDPILVLGEVYVAFGVAHAPHYRTMFGPAVRDCAWGPALRDAGRAAFGLLEAAVVQGQAAGRLRAGDSYQIAQIVWATVHGIVALADNGNLGGPAEATATPAELARAAIAALVAGLQQGTTPGESP